MTFKYQSLPVDPQHITSYLAKVVLAIHWLGRHTAVQPVM